jgi:hypothetical protein
MDYGYSYLLSFWLIPRFFILTYPNNKPPFDFMSMIAYFRLSQGHT